MVEQADDGVVANVKATGENEVGGEGGEEMRGCGIGERPALPAWVPL